MKSRQLLAAVSILISTIIGAMTWSSVNTLLPVIKQNLHLSVGQLQWMMNMYGICISSTLVMMGRLADLYGRKKIYCIGLVFMIVDVLGTGLSSHAAPLIIFQGVMGVATAVSLPVGVALYTQLFSEEEKSRALAVFASTLGVAIALGPVYSGFVSDVLHSWRWPFFILGMIFIVGLVLILLFVEESTSDEECAIVDWPGVALLTLTIACFVTAVLQIGHWPASLIAILFIATLVGLVLLWLVERSAPVPIIRADLFFDRLFLLSSSGNFILIFAIWAYFFLSPLYLHIVRGLDMLHVGLVMLLITMPLVFLSRWIGRWYAHSGPRLPMAIGFVFLMASTLLFLQVTAQSSLLLIYACLLLFGFAWCFIWTPSSTAAISTLPKAHAGIASGAFFTIQEIGGTVGLAVVGTVVRWHANFITGIHDGMVVLFAVGLLGLFISMRLPSARNFIQK